MKLSVSLFHCALLLLLGLVLCGCDQVSQSQSDEEKEPYFLTGKSRVSGMDYKGAIEAFEKALEVNPQSAAAHFELAWLFDQKEADPAAAIYHYEHYRKLQPKTDKARLAKERILACKQELAREVSLGPVTVKVQREFEQLTNENKRLTEENKKLREDLDKWSAYARELEVQTNRLNLAVAQAAHAAQTVSSTPSPTPNPSAYRPTTSTRSTIPPSSGVRTHKVAPGETPTVIARRYGIKVESLLAANPGLNARRMRAGQTLYIPSR
ncbi:MAG TPA: LysM peptidoglycan-binding domain-containing protein [Clostridia bacterium]|nr:LysM peptidoglycan-binding domain-containing protein [Clostridia bacterium]